MNTNMAPKHKNKTYIYLLENRDYWKVVVKTKRKGLSCLPEQLSDSHA